MKYTENYVKFFLHRNNVYNFSNFPQIKKGTLSDERIRAILQELKDWPCYEIKNHKNVDHPLHKLSFIAELGFTRDDAFIEEIVQRIMKNQSEEGIFQVLVKIPEKFGGSGKTIKSWMLCDATVLLYSLIKLNNNTITPELQRGIQHISHLVSENGWHCIVSNELGKFRGPGRKDDPCPYATMFAVKMLSLTKESDYKKEKVIGINTILNLWEKRTQIRPYLFAMGTDFKKLKLPFVWYDILNVVDTLSMYKEIQKDPRFQEMVGVIFSKKTEDGFIPESAYLKSKQWDFGQKKIQSEFLTAIIERIEKRMPELKASALGRSLVNGN